LFFLGEVFKQYRRARKRGGGRLEERGRDHSQTKWHTQSQALPTSQTQRRVQERDSRPGLRPPWGGRGRGRREEARKGGGGVGRPHRPVGSVL